jgi:hypothetical protein
MIAWSLDVGADCRQTDKAANNNGARFQALKFPLLNYRARPFSFCLLILKLFQTPSPWTTDLDIADFLFTADACYAQSHCDNPTPHFFFVLQFTCEHSNGDKTHKN